MVEIVGMCVRGGNGWVIVGMVDVEETVMPEIARG